MSMGYGAGCRKVAEDEKTLIYEYSVYNWNEIRYKDSTNLYDGMILMDKSAFIEPEVHTKRKRMLSGKKVMISKPVVNYNIPCETLLKDKSIIIENCSNAWSFSNDGIDNMAIRLVYNLFIEYQKQGVFVETLGISY